jgi:LacI family transcriptional regulator
VTKRRIGSRLKQVAVIYDAKLRYDVKIIEGVAAYVREVNDWDIFIEESALQNQKLPNLGAWKGDGILADFDDPTVARAVMRSGVTAVGFGGGYGWYEAASRVPYYYTNNAAIAELAADHLLQRGFRHFAFCGYHRTPINGWSDERAQSFSGRIHAAGFQCQHYRGPKHATRDWPAFRDSLARWLRSLPKPVAIMAATDKRARQVLDVCRFAGFRVPDDIAVVGVDNDEMLCQLCTPPLSSVEQGARRLGYEAAALLDRMMAGAKPASVRMIIDPVAVVARQSTDILCVEDPQVRQALKEINSAAGTGIMPAEVAKRVGCARSTLELRFHQALGRTIYAEIRRGRDSRAEQLVRETSLPLKQIAARCGFRSIQHMTTVFRERLGKTPAKLRRTSLA